MAKSTGQDDALRWLLNEAPEYVFLGLGMMGFGLALTTEFALKHTSKLVSCVKTYAEKLMNKYRHRNPFVDQKSGSTSDTSTLSREPEVSQPQITEAASLEPQAGEVVSDQSSPEADLQPVYESFEQSAASSTVRR